MKNKRIFIIIIFVFITSIGSFEINYAKNIDDKNTRIKKSISVNSEIEKNITKNDTQVLLTKSETRNIKLEIKRRKKYHRNLLYEYNKNFNKTDLSEIANNSLALDKLRTIYKKNLITKT
jgi:hypothetical protein